MSRQLVRRRCDRREEFGSHADALRGHYGLDRPENRYDTADPLAATR